MLKEILGVDVVHQIVDVILFGKERFAVLVGQKKLNQVAGQTTESYLTAVCVVVKLPHVLFTALVGRFSGKSLAAE